MSDSTEEQRRAFGQALDRCLADLDRTRAWLGAEVARIEMGPDANPYSQSAVTQWITGATEPTRSKVFAIEQALKVPAGTLSHHLGYLPLVADATVEIAIAADDRLTKEAKRSLVGVYRALVGSGR